MDEYIKREDVLSVLTYNGTDNPAEIIPLTLATARKKVRMIPAADVVPMKEQGQWILCKERLPKEAGKYLVKGTYKGDTKMWKCQFLSLGGFFGWANDARNPVVSEWWEPADVAPKIEVAREIFEEIEKAIYHLETPIGKYLVINHNRLAELKKKYTEGQ